ncbi:MAG TPA: hypothetical protein VFJ47_05130 [Terriglobales bacterium]|nr:hypothetical protein [Terriglobales bacterium]
MVRSATGYHFAILAILCTLAIFFFPLVSGPYPVTHGPATDFETVRAAQLLLAIIAVAAMVALARLTRHFALVISSSADLQPASLPLLPAIDSLVLRC